MRSTQPLISVILPCYNAQYFLPLALDSIIHQTYTNLEIICINDGSTDNTPNILEEYANKDKRIRVIHNETNLKLIATLNKAIAFAKGDYIARMDADDVSHLERIEKLYKTLIKEDADVVSCNSENIDIFGVKKSTGYLKAITPLEIEFASYLFTPIGHPSLLAKKNIFDSYKYSTYDNAYHTEDYELWTRMTRDGVSFYNLEETLYSYRLTASGVSRKFEDIQIANFVKCAKIHQELLLNKTLNESIVSVAVNRIDEPSIKNTRKGFKLIDEIFQSFKSKNKLNKQEVKSLSLIVTMQKTDILIQNLKKGDFKVRVFAGAVLFRLMSVNTFNSKLRGYLKSKSK